MKPIPGKIPQAGKEAQEARLICQNYKSWPPAPAQMGGDLHNLWLNEEITDILYQQTLVWRRYCGLLAMDEEVCLKCPHVRKITRRNLEYYADHLDGQPGAKLTDWRKAGAGAKYRRKPKPLARVETKGVPDGDA